MGYHIKKVISQILYNNIASQKSCLKMGFIYQKQIKRGGKKYKQYIYYFQLYDILKYEYPYLKHFITKKEIKKSFKLLQKYIPTFKKGNLKKFTNNMELIINFDKERHINQITDYFTDKCRVKCVFKNYISPIEYYKYNKGKIIRKSIIKNKFNITKFEEVMFNSNKVKFCNNFQTTIAFTLYKLFKPKNILDTSAGWGDRLIAAIAFGEISKNITYTGIDPSKCLKILYPKIIKTLSSKNNINNYKIINKGVENVDINKNHYDLCLTSPPFFDLETYENNSNTQSIKKYSSANKWEREFLIKLVEQNVKGLKKGGHLVLYVPTYYKYFMNYMSKHKKLEYLGIFSFLTPKRRDILIWKKMT